MKPTVKKQKIAIKEKDGISTWTYNYKGRAMPKDEYMKTIMGEIDKDRYEHLRDIYMFLEGMMRVSNTRPGAVNTTFPITTNHLGTVHHYMQLSKVKLENNAA